MSSCFSSRPASVSGRLLQLMACMAFVGASGFAGAEAAPYLAAGELRLTDYLASPPSDAATQAEDRRAVLDAQRRRTPEQEARARRDDVWRDAVFSFGQGILPDGFEAGRLPLTQRFFSRAQDDLVQTLLPAKKQYGRPRPYEQDTSLRPLLPPPVGDAYPSGHAMFGYLAATLLGMAVPERRDALFARAREHAASRVIAGVHYPSDLAAGQVAAAALAARLMATPAAVAGFAAMKAELRVNGLAGANNEEEQP